MRPWGHFVVAAVPVVGYVLARDGRLPSGKLWFTILFGSQFPDLIDKPLAHLFFVIPSGRVFIHSLPFAVPIAAAVLYVTWETEYFRVGAVFVFSYFSHILADSYRSLLKSGPTLPSDLFWPFLAPVARPPEPRWAGPGSINVKLWSAFSLVVLLVAVYFIATALDREDVV